MSPFACPLPHRGVLHIKGADRVPFLQGLVSNDVTKATAQTGVYAALLTPQGKFLHDLFIWSFPNVLWIDCEAARADDLIQRLTAYKLRSQVEIENVSDRFDVWAVWGDPHLPELGGRLFMEKGTVPTDVTPVGFITYDTHRLTLGIADGSRDLEIGHSTLAEGNFDLLGGIDWKKGCYVGQELTARMRYRGLAKKRLFPVRGEGTLPPHGAPLTLNGIEAGEMRSSCGNNGLALLKIDTAQKLTDEESPLTHKETKIFVSTPDWMKIDVQPVNL